jgi:hypothetical protein
MYEVARKSASRRDAQSGRPETPAAVVEPARWRVPFLLLSLVFPGGVLLAQGGSNPPRVLPLTLTGCDSTTAATPDTIYMADQVDRPVRPSRLPLQTIPLRLGHVLRGRSVLRFIVEPSGRINRCSLMLIQEGAPEWTDSVVRQLRSTRYEPARLKGEKVAQWVEQLFLFQNDARD